ncbi:MAG: hypothetical protein JW718_08785 [Desulfovibrionaceae bacterium]|nr:hypothetical protein [Desulfovibrionaceae bacterium]
MCAQGQRPRLGERGEAAATFAITLMVAYCSIVYELLMAQTLSAIMGNTVLRYSVTIGVYLASLGLGAFMCGDSNNNPAQRLMRVEIALSLTGGASVIAIHLLASARHLAANSFEALGRAPGDSVLAVSFFVLSHLIIVVIGILSGFEVPLLIGMRNAELRARGLARRAGTAVNVVLGVDYLGSLLGAVLFPLLLLPWLGIFPISYLTALINVAACLMILGLKPVRVRTGQAALVAGLGLLLLGLMAVQDKTEQFFLKKFYYSEKITSLAALLDPFSDRPEIRVFRSPYQRIHFVNRPDNPLADSILEALSGKFAADPGFPRDTWLFMEHQYQFFSNVEEFYHEFFVHAPIQMAEPPQRVLVLGAGDGLAVRELLKYPRVRSVTLVDLDPVILALARDMPLLRRMNKGSLLDPRVRTVAADAFAWLGSCRERYDAIYCDFPRPTNFDLSRLFSREFYTLVRLRLAPGGFAAADLPGDGLWTRYSSTLRAAGFGTVLPFEVALDPNDPALDAAENEFATMGGLVRGDEARAMRALFRETVAPRVLNNVRQRFVFLRAEKSRPPAAFRDPGVALRALDAGRFALAVDTNLKDARDPGLVNSVLRPTIPALDFESVFELKRPG